MCIIIDANVASQVFSPSPAADPKTVIDWIDFGGGKLIVGGRLKMELGRLQLASRWIRERERSGKVKVVSDRLVDTEEARLLISGRCKSNDQHIIALARVSRARLLYSHDQTLHDDFRNHRLISKPRGSIYTNARNCAHLLVEDLCP